MNTLAGSEAFSIVDKDVNSGHDSFGSNLATAGRSKGAIPSNVSTKAAVNVTRKRPKRSAAECVAPCSESKTAKYCDHFASDEDKNVAKTTTITTQATTLDSEKKGEVRNFEIREKAQHAQHNLTCRENPINSDCDKSVTKKGPEGTRTKRQKIAPVVNGTASLLYVPNYTNNA